MAGSVRARILLFARAPQPGQVKTRLIARIGPRGAATLHARLVEAAIGEASTAGVGPIELWCTPTTDHPFFSRCAQAAGVTLHRQCAGSLGDKMAMAARCCIEAGHRALLVGTDAPALTAARIREAARALDDHDAVIVPAHDGGYVLLGMRSYAIELFEGVAWGTEHVYEQTVQRLRRLGCSWTALAGTWDVDRPDDLDELARHRPELLAGLTACGC